ncbi:MAG: hypothetical protein KOO63_05760 [Bacteroidales bacterium]|nr:hypothetical protein [Candidatus Latescibacterota bacterium]
MIRLLVTALLLCALPGMGQDVPGSRLDRIESLVEVTSWRTAHLLAQRDSLVARIDSLEAKLARAHVVAVVDSGMATITHRAYMQQGRESIPIEGTEYTTREMHYFTRYEISFEEE